MAGFDPGWGGGQWWQPDQAAEASGHVGGAAPEEDHSSAALAVLVQAIGRQPGLEAASMPEALFAEAVRLLTAVLGFACEGNCPPLLRGRAVIRGAQQPNWRGLVPHALLGKWFDFPALLAVFWSEALRAAVEGAQQGARLEFFCALSRAAMLEQLGQSRAGGLAPGGRGLLRAGWRKVFDSFPELGRVRTLCAHIRRRCWEDARDRSRSRSRSREKKKKEKQAAPSDSVRFFVKGFGPAEENFLERHFQRFGTLMELNILRDKRTKRTRGMAFVTLKPEGSWRGQKNTKQMMKDWVFESYHDIKGVRLEVTEADTKPPEDDEKKREERVEERRKRRLEQEMRSIVPRDPVPERLILSPWAKRWRQEIWQTLPKEVQGPAPWTDPRVRVLGTALWREATEYVERAGGKDLQEALAFFRSEGQGAQEEWAFMPVADLLLVVGEGLIGITVEGIFALQAPKDPVTPATGNDLASMDTPSFAPAPVNMTGMAGPNANFGGQFDQGRLVHGRGSDNEKIFVGGLTQATTLDMLTGYFGKYGSIVDAVVMVDKATGKPRGFGFVVFDRIERVDAVIRDHGRHIIDGKWVDVKRATPQAVMQGTGATVASSGGPTVVQPPASAAGVAVPTPPPPVTPAAVGPGAVPGAPPRQEQQPEAAGAFAAPAAAVPPPRVFAEVAPPGSAAPRDAAPASAQPVFGAVAPPTNEAPASASESSRRSFSEFSLPKMFLPSAAPGQAAAPAPTGQAAQYDPLAEMQR